MYCQNCNERPASVHVTKIINGEKTELYLCEHCAREKGELTFVTEPFSINTLLAGILKSNLHPERKVMKPVTDYCQSCGISFPEFSKTGRFGCSECYDEFNLGLSQLIRRIHGSDQHTGKVPQRLGGTLLLKREIAEMRNEIQRAVVKEEFERAAELRDRIYDLEKQLLDEDGGES
ncbi:MAG: UvrB/UvrC motif-containing protein [Halanaerobiales bacterium]|nr:UvrB/UvrC motif-containing protein [Halanaerobiales bacterium]